MRLFNILAGALGGIAALGIGSLIPAIRHLPAWLRLPLSLLAGFSIAVFSTVPALTFGAGPGFLRAFSLFLSGLGIVGLVIAPPVMRLPKWSVASAFLFAGLGLTLLPALAPSSKADEIRYHMLVPKRIIQDGGLRGYREPWEAAIYSQMGYQMTESLAWAWRLQDAPNLWSWWMTAAIAMLIAGSARRLSNNSELSLFAAAAAVLSLHPSVNLVTAGSQAFGDLAMLVAVILALFPEDLILVTPSTRVLMVSAATCAAAISKASFLPISLLILAYAIVRGSSARGRLKYLAIALSIWTVGYMPLVVWSFLQTGSPFGIATAGLFHSGFFGQATITKFVSRQHLYRFGGLRCPV